MHRQSKALHTQARVLRYDALSVANYETTEVSSPTHSLAPSGLHHAQAAG